MKSVPLRACFFKNIGTRRVDGNEHNSYSIPGWDLQIWRSTEPVLAKARIDCSAPRSSYCGTTHSVLDVRLVLHPNCEGRTFVNNSIPNRTFRKVKADALVSVSRVTRHVPPVTPPSHHSPIHAHYFIVNNDLL